MLRILFFLSSLLVIYVLTDSKWVAWLFFISLAAMIVWAVFVLRRKPTERMISYALSLADQHGIPPPNLNSFSATRRFLNRYGDYKL